MTQHAAMHPRQWHPAFYAIIQIELMVDSNNLTFENEHLLSKKPMQIDVLIIKKETNFTIVKNIGKIFRKYNIFEYKGPNDYISIDDFYKVYGYACFYKSDSNKVDDIQITEITISFVCSGYPRKLMKHLKKLRKFKIRKICKGIYYVTGDILPIQFIIQSQLSKEENLWLKSLTDKLTKDGSAELLLNDYQQHKSCVLYESAMDMIMRSNIKQFGKEDPKMCEAILEMMQEELNQKFEDGKKLGEDTGRKLGEDAGRKLGEARIARINTLNLKLLDLGRIDDIKRAACDSSYQQQLLDEFKIV